MKVRNLNRTTQGACPSGTWFTHWEIYSGQNAFMCFVKGCIRRPTVGGRVQKDSLTDKSWYVIPLCEECNKRGGEDLDIWDSAKLISVNVLRVPEKVGTVASSRMPRLARSFI